MKHKGVGRKLHEVLEAVLKEQGILNMEACIGYPEVEDEYLDKKQCQFPRTHGIPQGRRVQKMWIQI